jgi:hypothetical protein
MTQFTLVDVVPQTHSNEIQQDSEPSIGVNPANPNQILISAFTSLDPTADPGETNGPLYVSQDGGASWNLSYIVPDGMPLDQTYKFGGISNEFYGGDISGASMVPTTIILNALRTANPFVPGTMAVLKTATPTDQPFIEATTVRYGPDTGKDRFYIGYNDQEVTGTTGHTATIDVCLDATAAMPVLTTVHIEQRATPDWFGLGHQDGPQVRPAVHSDGTIYAIFNGVRTFDSGASTFTADMVVVRDDNWGSGAMPFTALVDPNDGVAGYRVQTGVALTWLGLVGNQRTAGAFSIAVDPRDSNIVYICWAGPEAGVFTLHVQRSTTRGASWSPVLLQIANATNPALAISTTGRIGLLYQQNTGTSPTDKWETHFQESTNGTVWHDTLLASTPRSTPTPLWQPYLGDYLDLVAIGKNFYGTFCANNTPDPANFPTVMPTWMRNIDAAAHHLLGTDNMTVVAASIDPFFMKAVVVPASSDFYVRDWTDSAASADDGLEPSTHWDFWNTSDVWNQFSTNVAFSPNANDQLVSENAQAGADNYAFARIRRNELPASGSGSTTVSAHFLVSEFGTGSNFVDWVFSDPSDPDVSFPTFSDVSVVFNEGDKGPLITPPLLWHLDATVSDHCCLAVQINSPGDPMASPGLTGRAPGTPGATFSVVNDNNKAQRNLQVNPAVMGGIRGSHYYGIVHNAATFTRDIVLGLAVPRGLKSVPEGTMIEIVTERGIAERRPWSAWDRIALKGMTPGENRWIGVNLRVPTAAAPATVAFAELKGDRPVNGFAITARPAPVEEVINDVLVFHGKVLKRLDLGFHVAGAAPALEDFGGFITGREPQAEGEPSEGFDFHERVSVEKKDLRIEIDVRIRGLGGGEVERTTGVPAARTPIRYERFIRRQAKQLRDCLDQLGGGDPFAIGQAIGEITDAPSADLTTIVAAHASVLHKFDAFMTMLQKARGDRADILQMVLWHHDLCERSARIAALPDTAAVKQRLAEFIDRVEARTLRLDDYGALLTHLAPALHRAASGLHAAALDPLVDAMTAETTARGRQKAHREFLLELRHHA